MIWAHDMYGILFLHLSPTVDVYSFELRFYQNLPRSAITHLPINNIPVDPPFEYLIELFNLEFLSVNVLLSEGIFYRLYNMLSDSTEVFEALQMIVLVVFGEVD